jgi:putative ABC transport system substrate-binding protein
MFRFSNLAEVGGLVTHEPNLDDLLGRAATDVDKILRGAKPGDLPLKTVTASG